MSKILEKRDDVFCFIIGKGYMKETLQNCIKQLDLQNHVKLLGWKTDQELPIWLNAADVFVFPSLAESFGIVQIEAMACGKPVVATYNGGSENIIISDECGLLVEPANSADLAEKIELALNKRWDNTEIQYCAKQYQWEKIGKETSDIYNSVIDMHENF
ncbi:MAG: glycosyltransferase [bacterium]